MTSHQPPSYIDHLRHAATSTRDLLAHAPSRRWEFFAKASASRELEVTREGSVQVIQAEEMGVSVRTSHEGRSGFAAASGIDVSAARRAIDTAIANQVPSAIDPLPPARLVTSAATAPSRQLPPQGWGLHIAQQIGAALTTCSGSRVQLLKCMLQEGEFSWILATDHGSVATHSDVSSSIVVDTIVDGERCGLWREWLHIADPDRFDGEEAARLICDRALLTHIPISGDAGLRDLILHGEATAHLISALMPLFLARRENDDPLPALLSSDGLLAAPALSLVDDRADPEAPITGPCDGEGMAARKILLIEHGAPRHRIASFRDALLCGETPRGGALRLSYRDYPSSAAANARVATDHGLPPAELLGMTDRALYLLRPVAPIALDLASDSYHMVASGVWLAGGRVRSWHPVVELKGSLGSFLRRIEAVGTDRRWYQCPQGFVGAPSILVRRQRVLG
jgi:predicted Zn-dependent protease